MPTVRLQHNGKSVSIKIDADAPKVRNHNPLRFRITHDVEVNTGINTWFMSRGQLEEVNLQVMTEILEAKQPGSEEALDAAEKRVAFGQQALVRAVQQIGHLTHPDVMMLIDMRQNPNQYVNSSSAFANMFNALARKVMDLSFYATLNGPYARLQRENFIRTTGAVTRGMDQFIYCRPNASAANPYVNFSVIPAGQNFEDVRFPTYYDARTQTKEKIPKMRFEEIYAYYVNELFDCYRRYLRMLGAVEALPGNTGDVSANVLAQAPGDGPGEGGDGSDAVLAGLEANETAEREAEQRVQDKIAEAEQRARDDAAEAEGREESEQYNKAARKTAKREQKMKERAKAVKKAVKGALNEFKAEHEAKKQKTEAVSPPAAPDAPVVATPTSPAAESSTGSSSSAAPAEKQPRSPMLQGVVADLMKDYKTTGNPKSLKGAILGKMNKLTADFSRAQLEAAMREEGYTVYTKK